MNKIEALNSIEFTDWSCCNGECEYVLAENISENIEILLNAGFTKEQIDESIENDEDYIDLSILAFQYTNADWFNSVDGFKVE